MSHEPRTRIRTFGSYSPSSQLHYSYRIGQTGNYTNVYWPIGFTINLGQESCADMTHPGPPYHCGGGLDIWRHKRGLMEFGSFDCHSYPGFFLDYHYRGTWRRQLGVTTSGPSGYGTTWGDGSSYGATGWNRFKPGKPGADLAVFLAELRDMPKMLKFRLRSFKDLGSQYLNYQFGWRPFYNDLCKFFDTTRTLQRRYEFLRKNNGKWLRRGGVVDSSIDVSSTTLYGQPVFYPVLPTQFWPTPLSAIPTRVVETTARKVWFEASFRFWIPDLGSQEWIDRTLRQLYGFSLSPAVVWELIPWSWLVDWFTNVGDVISNISESSAAENLVARYAYVMTHSVFTREYSTDAEYYTNVNAKSKSNVSARSKDLWERKQRIAASPYGFGLSEGDLSLRQMSILAALGITRWT